MVSQMRLSMVVAGRAICSSEPRDLRGCMWHATQRGLKTNARRKQGRGYTYRIAKMASHTPEWHPALLLLLGLKGVRGVAAFGADGQRRAGGVA